MLSLAPCCSVLSPVILVPTTAGMCLCRDVQRLPELLAGVMPSRDVAQVRSMVPNSVRDWRRAHYGWPDRPGVVNG